MKYVNMQSSQALDSFVQKKCKSLMQRIGANEKKYKISLKVEGSSRTPEGVINSYKVVGDIQIARQGRMTVVKTGKDVRLTISDVVEALETKIRRYTEKRERSRKTLGRSLKPLKSLKWDMGQTHS